MTRADTGMRSFHALSREWTARFVSRRATRVSFLTGEKLRPIPTQPVPEFPLHYQDGALEHLLALTRGQPYLTQAAGKELVDLLNWENLNREKLNPEKRLTATPTDVDAAAAKALRAERIHDEIPPLGM